MESEVRFSQVQSRYSLLLNELINPHDGFSLATRDVAIQLLKDIESQEEKKTLGTVSYDK